MKKETIVILLEPNNISLTYIFIYFFKSIFCAKLTILNKVTSLNYGNKFYEL